MINFPSSNDIAAVLRDLLDREVTVSAVPSGPLTEPTIVSVYALDNGTPAVIGIQDLPLAASLGAGLIRLSPSVASASAKGKRLEGEIVESLREVMNVCAQFFNRDQAAHVLFKDLLQAPPPLPGNIKALIGKERKRMDFTIKVSGYGGGRLSIREL